MPEATWETIKKKIGKLEINAPMKKRALEVTTFFEEREVAPPRKLDLGEDGQILWIWSQSARAELLIGLHKKGPLNVTLTGSAKALPECAAEVLGEFINYPPAS